ncbi:hypothetical protein HHL22_20450 [Hymenobacter sp. RP-2-7]|uniref:Tyr recombinase domain-containing protein n=1 Tax=Hymenobacter polaris TaxID=2682546 RepID=A0A7Y0AHQ2_9BACT|nr:hypothetical protein [Hymenobacter polaris]NML67578.1 hypothetical protein [Hymenobacter polaris]
MYAPAAYKRKITVSFKPRREKQNKQGLCPVRAIVRWHGQEFLFATGEMVPLSRPGKAGKMEVLWTDEGWVQRGNDQAAAINARLSAWELRITTVFNGLFDAAPFTPVPKVELLAALFPEGTTEAGGKPAQLRTFREVLEEWKKLNRNLGVASLRKYDQMATRMEQWRPELRPAAVTQGVALEYVQHLLDLQKADATIKVHLRAIKFCLETLGLPSEHKWLEYSAKNAPQLDLEVPELWALLALRPPSEAHRIERDRWVLQLLCGRRYEDMAKLDPRQRTPLYLADGKVVPALNHAQGKTASDTLVPLPPLAVRLGERYNWQFPAATHIVRNQLMKEVARAAGLTREFDDRTISGGKAISHWRLVWQVIGTHTARHTGATLIKQASGNKSLAKLLLGHADEDVTDVYAKDHARQLAPALLAAWQQVLGQWYDAELPLEKQ